MKYETSYDVGLKPYTPDKNRGKWASPKDFLLACVAHSFRMDGFLLPSLIFSEMGINALIPYLIIMTVCTIPIIFMQSFLGQFSSTGFISVFRIAPLFKGIGYVSLALNITTLTYCSIFGAISMFYFFHSLRPTLPWSCEGSVDWFKPKRSQIMPCNLTNITLPLVRSQYLAFPSVNFLKNHLNIIPNRFNIDRIYIQNLSYSWLLILCTLVIWIGLWAILRKPTEVVGYRIIYLIFVFTISICLAAIFTICILRFMFLPGAMAAIINCFEPSKLKFQPEGFFVTPLIALSGLGPGWGTTLTMASYNSFKTDIRKYTWILCLGQFGLMMLTSFSWMFIKEFLFHFVATTNGRGIMYISSSSRQWIEFASIPSALTLLEMPNFWSLLFSGMLFLGATNLLIVQLFSVLTSLFDEFELLRARRDKVIRIIIGTLALVSILYCCNFGILTFHFLAKYSILSQMFLNLMLLLVVLWIYGRERYQRDLRFMTGRTYPTWMVYIVRFVTPIFLLITFIIGFIFSLINSNQTDLLFFFIENAILVPWLLIPGYCIFRIMRMTGFLGRRLRRSVRPTDWYPVDPVDRQNYEETFSNTDNSHNLATTLNDI